MKGLKNVLCGVCVTCLILLVVGWGCTQVRQNTGRTTATYTYDYFPIESVYWDSQRRTWFYPWDGTWQSSANLPSGIRLDTRNYVVITMDTPTPYKYHSEVAQRFPPGDYVTGREGKNVYVTIGPKSGGR